MRGPLRLAGVLLAGTFYPGTLQDAWGPLHLEAGLVALAPLTPVVTSSATGAAATAFREASGQWADGGSTTDHVGLSWHPIGGVREPADGRSVGELIALMSTANDARLSASPSTPPYHRAARELEQLATVLYDTTSSEERLAEDAALRRGGPSRKSFDD